jgi:hypothetical protein
LCIKDIEGTTQQSQYWQISTTVKHNIKGQDNKTSKDDYMTPHKNTGVSLDTSTRPSRLCMMILSWISNLYFISTNHQIH